MLAPLKGLGVAVPPIHSEQGSRYFFHTGRNQGFRCIMIGNIQGQGAVIMTNSNNGEALHNEILASIAKFYKWKDAEQVDMLEPLMDPLEAKNVDPVKWFEKSKGIYEFSPHQDETVYLQIYREDRKTMGQITVKLGNKINKEDAFEVSALSETLGCFQPLKQSPYHQIELLTDSEEHVVGISKDGNVFKKSKNL